MMSDVGAGLPPAGSAVMAMVVTSVSAADDRDPGIGPEQAERDRRAAVDRPELVGRAVVERRQLSGRTKPRPSESTTTSHARVPDVAGEGRCGFGHRRGGDGLGIAAGSAAASDGASWSTLRLATTANPTSTTNTAAADGQDDPGQVRAAGDVLGLASRRRSSGGGRRSVRGGSTAMRTAPGAGATGAGCGGRSGSGGVSAGTGRSARRLGRAGG